MGTLRCLTATEFKNLVRKQDLTDRTLKALKAAPEGKRYEIVDTRERGLAIRVTERLQRTFVLIWRYPGSGNPTRRALGVYDVLSLEEARQKARDWKKLLGKGTDPAIEETRQRAAERQKQANTFEAVAEDFIKDKLPSERKGKEVELDIRREFLPRWAKLPITEITEGHILDVIEAKALTAPAQARNLLGTVKRLFAWAKNSKNRRRYGLIASPASDLKPLDIIGKKNPRTRILSEGELKAAWEAADDLGYPYGPLFRLLILTGQRKSEVAEAQWSEFDLAKNIWTISAERMKADVAHAVPLSDDALTLLKKLPTFASGDYLFSTTFGKKPVNGFSKAKVLFDKAIVSALRKNDAKAKLPGFVIHDLRRTVRTGLSAIPNTSDLVRELVIGHTRPGMHKVYDLYLYLDEKRAALDAWAARVRSIVNPPPANVVNLVRA